MDEEIEKAVEEVDREEDEEAAKRKQGGEKSEKIVYICPKCKLLVNEADFAEDEVTEAFTTGMASKIECTNCGYEGLPLEVDRGDYEKMSKQGKKA